MDTLTSSSHTSGSIDVDWYDGSTWSDTVIASALVVALRWEISAGVGMQDTALDASGADLTNGAGVDTTQGTDSGVMSFTVIVK